ncbi:hypothetical protein RUM43_004874 [Polyplax serrata]|uniref:Uncharacterized protein n=1 Tax=Polyplax serrata TaxID=468196 RepID=A0AAN8SCN9_POLSC
MLLNIHQPPRGDLSSKQEKLWPLAPRSQDQVPYKEGTDGHHTSNKVSVYRFFLRLNPPLLTTRVRVALILLDDETVSWKHIKPTEAADTEECKVRQPPTHRCEQPHRYAALESQGVKRTSQRK